MAASELPIDTNVTGLQMAQAIFGSGAEVLGATFVGDNRSSGIYSNGNAVSPNTVPADAGVILSTGLAQDFTNASGQENQSSFRFTDTAGPDNLPEFNILAGTRTHDAAYLDVDFRPDTDLLTMQFVFSSEEYPEFSNSIYQDFVGVWVNGTRVDMSIGNGDVDPGNVNSSTNVNLYKDNTGDAFNTEMDGFTVTMTLKMAVNAGDVNSIRIGIADVADSSYDSNLLIAADSLQTDLIALDDDVSMHPTGVKTVDVTGNDINESGSTLEITKINGEPVSVGSEVTLTTGAKVVVNANGTLTLVGDGDTEDYNFTYQVWDGTNTDTGFVNVSQVPCFVAGTLIATPDGLCPVQDLKPGDMVLTKDDGAQPLRWAGNRTVAATGNFAPIAIRNGTFGTHGDLMVSPLHRILIKDVLADLLFGEAEVLVAAKDLVNDRTVRRCEGGEVTYVHLLFDRHQVIYSEGLATESFLPGPQTQNSFEAEVVEEICAIFPELDPVTGEGYGPPARRSLRQFEAQLLMQKRDAA